MAKCDPRAFARCPYNGTCLKPELAEFQEGSDCDAFNRKVLNGKITNGDVIRGMNDRELAVFLYTITRACADRTCETCPIGGENCIVMIPWVKKEYTRWNE